MKKTSLLVLSVLITSCGNNKSNSNSETGMRPSTLTEEAVVYSALSADRGNIVFNDMNFEERKNILTQARIALGELYVNRLKKMKTHGLATDPLPKLDRFEAEYMNAPMNVFHTELAKIFSSQRDHHTWYQAPAPAGCYTAFLPISVVSAKSADQRDVSVVKSVRTKGNTLEIAPEVKDISVGDILISINGRSPKAEMARLNPHNAGANDPAFIRTAHGLLTYRTQDSMPLPTEDRAELVFQNTAGNQYQVSLPWMSLADKECLSPNKDKSAGRADFGSSENTYVTKYEKFYRDPIETTKKKSLFTKSFQTDSTSADKSFTRLIPATATAEPTISWWAFTSEGKNFGVIRLDSFSPSKVTVNKAKEIIAGILSKEMSKYDGVIFDLRNNGGGIINYGQSLAELVTGKPLDVLKFQMLNTPATRYIFDTIWQDSPFAKVLREAQAQNAVMTKAINMDGSYPEQIYKRGQVYFGPVAIFTNSSCYSTCDMMSALFQDHGLAEIWAEDGQTGAGGANNWNLNYILESLPKDKLGVFKELPGMNLGFAFRQTVRTGKYAGVLLEDEGVKADFVVETTVDDVINSGRSQFVKIAASLAKKKNEYLSSAKFNEKSEFETSKDSLNLMMDIKATDKIQVYSKGKMISEEAVSYSTESQTVTIKIAMDLLAKNGQALEIRGFDGVKPAWRKIATVRKIKEALKLASEQTLAVDFSNGQTPFMIYNDQDDETLGWSISGAGLQIGNGKEYANNLYSSAAIFVDLANKKDASLTFDLESYTEKDYDFVGVFIDTEDDSVQVVPWTSGDQANKNYKIDLAPFAGKKVEVRYEFKSDEAITAKGVTLKNIIIK